jgi:hypothetical protein
VLTKSKPLAPTSLRLTHPTTNGGTVTFRSPIVKHDPDGAVWVEIPKRVRTMPFPPLSGKRYAKFYVRLDRV